MVKSSESVVMLLGVTPRRTNSVGRRVEHPVAELHDDARQIGRAGDAIDAGGARDAANGSDDEEDAEHEKPERDR